MQFEQDWTENHRISRPAPPPTAEQQHLSMVEPVPGSVEDWARLLENHEMMIWRLSLGGYDYVRAFHLPGREPRTPRSAAPAEPRSPYLVSPQTSDAGSDAIEGQ